MTELNKEPFWTQVVVYIVSFVVTVAIIRICFRVASLFDPASLLYAAIALCVAIAVLGLMSILAGRVG